MHLDFENDCHASPVFMTVPLPLQTKGGAVPVSHLPLFWEKWLHRLALTSFCCLWGVSVAQEKDEWLMPCGLVARLEVTVLSDFLHPKPPLAF